MSDTIEVVEVVNVVPLRHQVGKLVIATLVAFAATKLTEKAYDATLRTIATRASADQAS